MADRKALFFDIDGTLWDYHNQIPVSTIKAIQEVRRRGHLAFLCSGRTRAFIRDPKLLDIGFDGIVSGCGTMIEYEGKTLFYHQVEADLVEYTVRTVRSCGFRPILEGKTYLYMDDSEFAKDSYGRKLKAELGERLRTINGEWGRWEISKLACATENADRETCFAALEEYYDYMIHNEAVVEMVPKGFHKGAGIRRVCELLGLDISDTFAFGDSVNDIGMLRDAGIGVAMGNGCDAVTELADYVTTPMIEDGIWNACRHFRLI